MAAWCQNVWCVDVEFDKNEPIFCYKSIFTSDVVKKLKNLFDGLFRPNLRK